MPKNAPDDSIRRHGSSDSRGGIIYTNERGDRAIKLSSSPRVRVYSERDKRIGPVFGWGEKAQDFVNRN